MSKFLTYANFHSLQEAQELLNLLKKSNIEFEVEHEKDILDKIYVGESMDPMISVKIQEDRFEYLNNMLLFSAESQLNDINPNYYLFSFSNQELIEVSNNRNEWNHFDQALARKLLSDKKIEIPEDTNITTDALTYFPSHLENRWLISQYILTLLLPYIGIIIGLATLFAYKTLKSGEKVKMYDEATRQHAKIMLGLGILRTLYFFIARWIYYVVGA